MKLPPSAKVIYNRYKERHWRLSPREAARLARKDTSNDILEGYRDLQEAEEDLQFLLQARRTFAHYDGYGFAVSRAALRWAIQYTKESNNENESL